MAEILIWGELFLKETLIILDYKAVVFIYLIQGEQGPQGVTGPRGLPGEGFPGAKVSRCFRRLFCVLL